MPPLPLEPTSTDLLAQRTLFWQKKLAKLIPEGYEVVVDHCPVDESEIVRGQPLRSSIFVVRQSNGQRVVTGMVRESESDHDAECAATQETLYGIPPEWDPVTLQFFLCDKNFKLFEVTTDAENEPSEPATWNFLKEVNNDRDIQKELRKAIQETLRCFQLGGQDLASQSL